MVTPKKHLGQHFLKDKEVARKISDSLTISTPSLVEVGPGTGVLTQFLLQKNTPVYAYEVDKDSVEYLHEHFPQKNITVFNQDFLKADLQSTIPAPYSVCGNFPYNISSQIVFKILENHEQIPEMVGMFQKEVAERICAPHGNKIYGIISVLTQAIYHTEYLFTVDEQVFNPPPKVKSGVIRFIRKKEIPDIPTALFYQIVKTAFNQRRKKLSNALKSLTIPFNLQDHKFLNLRAEQLSVEDFLELTHQWNEQFG